MAIRKRLLCIGTAAVLAVPGLVMAEGVAQAAVKWSADAASLVAQGFAQAHRGDAGFGGVWLEETGDGPRVVVGVVGKLQVPAAVDTGNVGVRYQPVRYTEAELQAEVARLAKLNWQRADLSYSAYVDLVNNRVVVSPERS